MDTRDAFLNFARDKHYEFSSLRRAQFSTMALLYELHTSTTDKFTYNCNTCRQQCEIRYHCTVCEDFDLCEKCYNIEPKHEHKMERSVPSIVEDCDQNSSNPNGKSMASSQLQRQQSMQRCIEALLHAVNCRNANCVNRSCFRYKRVIQHTKECKGKNSQCNVCKQVIFLCWYHAKSCMDQHCQVPFCTNLKTKIQKQRATSLQTDRRRMQAMMQQRTSTIQSQSQGKFGLRMIYSGKIEFTLDKHQFRVKKRHFFCFQNFAHTQKMDSRNFAVMTSSHYQKDMASLQTHLSPAPTLPLSPFTLSR
jgi:E1A/CREB-binding protein